MITLHIRLKVQTLSMAYVYASTACGTTGSEYK